MPASPTGLTGSIGDPASTNSLGGLNTCIGYGYQAVARPNATFNVGNWATDQTPLVHRIGVANPTEEAFASGYTSKRIRYKTASGAVASNAQVSASPFSVLNRTGGALVTNDGAFAVEA